MPNSSAQGIRGLRHLALKVTDLEKSRSFYEVLFGMKIVWQPDADNLYLSSGSDNLALHRIPAGELGEFQNRSGQLMDHFGLIVDTKESVDRLYKEADQQAERLGAKILKPPKRHRDGSYSFYLSDPDGNAVQVLYEPTLSLQK